jgi:hypothetical protein
MRIVAATFIVLLSFFGCDKKSQGLTQNDRVRVTQEVTEMLNTYAKAVQKNGLIAEFDFLDNSEDFFWIPPGYTSPLNYDSIRAILERNSNVITSSVFRHNSLLIVPLSKRLASYSSNVFCVMTDTSGAVNEFRLLETGTLIKRPDGWKLLNGQTVALGN